ncbi:MAG: HAMP domain-containing protein [Betaproteobacteria bacterium]|nr:HAMP domain-containing protein [Betaproteobacteria bacterium]
MRYALILCVGLVAIALFLVGSSSTDPALFAERYPLLLVLNGVVAFMLTALVVYQVITLRRELKAGVFGSRLTLRLVLLFALMAVLPGALIYGMSVQFLARSIESWFEVRVDRALEGGLNLGRGMLDTMLKDLSTKADAMALALSARPPAEHLAALNALREQAGTQEATLFNERGRVLAFSGNERVGLMPELPAASALKQFRAQRSHSAVEAIPDKGLYLRVLVPVYGLALADEPRVLQLLQPVPRQLAQDAEAVQSGYREYQELTLSRRGLKRLYGLTLTLALLLALLSALALAFVLSDRLSAPLGVLVEGTRAVASGDFSQRVTVAARDEIGMLTESFNSMTRQLAEARAESERHQAAQAEALRAAAWAEVARRLAHEIRNPLTPIQLSAERLQLKLAGRLAEADAEVLTRSTQTIVNQVAALKSMVDAFSQYARTPEPSMRELDLNALTREVLTLYESSLGPGVRLELAPGLPPVVGDAAQLRQVIHNLLQNAQDALTDTREPHITIASSVAEDAIQLTVTDNGCGFPEQLMPRAFEPYVTTKPKGTGLGLAIVKKIVEEHGGAATIANVAPRGARVSIRLPAVAQDAARRRATQARV